MLTKRSEQEGTVVQSRVSGHATAPVQRGISRYEYDPLLKISSPAPDHLFQGAVTLKY